MSRSRYLISGTLTTRTPLHIGNGTTTERGGLLHPETQKPVAVNAVMVDHRQKPYLPGTSLKGVLRRECIRLAGPEGLVADLFGGQELGGAAEIWDSPAEKLGDSVAPEQHPLRWWSEERWTEVAPRVAMDRTTGTASHRRLFHDEVVPADVRFRVTVTARTDEAGAALLLAGLQAFRGDDDSPTLGADSGNGWGRLAWNRKEIRCLDDAGARRWLAAGARTTGWDALERLEGAALAALEAKADALGARAGSRSIALDLRLSFDGLFLVNDASQTGEGEELPSHAARQAADGTPLLPATSFRGALRSQAERILRTVAGEQAACGPGAPRPPCSSPRSLAEVPDLCPACRLFGAAGWRSPLAVSDFTVGREGTRAGQEITQELLAIDRFTGGGAPGLKFNAKAFDSPVLQGTLRLDLEALDRLGGELWAFGLLALVLRDAVEGDIRFGFGAGKGFGHAKAQVVSHQRPGWEALPLRLRAALTDEGLTEETLRAGAAQRLQDEDTNLGIALSFFINELATVGTASAAASTAAWAKGGS